VPLPASIRKKRAPLRRAGVQSRHAEIALGHVLPGVEGTYDVHDYESEKLAAFEALAIEIEHLVRGDVEKPTGGH
jgi:hypothetical protein